MDVPARKALVRTSVAAVSTVTDGGGVCRPAGEHFPPCAAFAAAVDTPTRLLTEAIPGAALAAAVLIF